MLRSIARLLVTIHLLGAAALAQAAVDGRQDELPSFDSGADKPSEPAVPDPRIERARQLVESGIRYEFAEGVGRDYARSHSLYCAAARAEFADAFIRLGWMYGNGHGVIRSEAVAQALFHRAAELGSDMGERLSDLFRGSGEQLPACLGGAEPIAEPPAPPPASVAQTPSILEPAQFRTALPTIERRKVVELVIRLARQFRLDPRLVLALISTESGFDPLARSPKNAQGLMQLIPDTAERFAVKDVFDPLENLRGGMSYLRWLLAYFKGDVMLAVAAYNAGEGAVDKFKGVPPFAETIAYVQRIRTLYPLDFHPFEPAAAAASLIFSIRREAVLPAAARTPRS